MLKKVEDGLWEWGGVFVERDDPDYIVWDCRYMQDGDDAGVYVASASSLQEAQEVIQTWNGCSDVWPVAPRRAAMFAKLDRSHG